MNRFIVTADLHARKNRLDVFRRLMGDLLQLSRELDAKVIMNGDMWEEKDQSSRELLVELYGLLVAFHGDLIWMRGNHESPLRSDPHHSLMRLYGRVANLVLRPRILEDEQWIIYLVPWYPAILFKRVIDRVAKAALQENRQKILITHVGLKEGIVSESNRHVNQEVLLKDLYPEVFDLVLLGDYHAHQMLRENTLYLGSPISHTFGDFDNVGPWLLELGNGAPRLEPLTLPSTYPQFVRWRIESENGLMLPGFDQANHNRIEAVLSLTGKVKRLYPSAEVWPIDDREKPEERTRMSSVSSNNPVDVFKALCKSKGWRDPRYLKLGLDYIKKAGELT